MEEAETPTHRPPPFLEVKCQSSGVTRRFAIGTDAGFAVSLINNKLGRGEPLSLHIEAVKQGEEPISFGPNSPLVDYGDGWMLQTVTQLGFLGVAGEGVVRRVPVPGVGFVGSDNLHAVKMESKPEINFMYIGKILLAFALIFVLGAILTLFLENIPSLLTLLK